MLLQFNRSVNLLYRQSLAGKQPALGRRTGWTRANRPRLLETQRAAAFKNELPRVIRPDIILTENGPRITELDSVPGGIGLTAWLNQTYSALHERRRAGHRRRRRHDAGFCRHFRRRARRPHRHFRGGANLPAGNGLAGRAAWANDFKCATGASTDFKNGEAVYRFFELFDLPNVSECKTDN